jgi:hypothetical protein
MGSSWSQVFTAGSSADSSSEESLSGASSSESDGEESHSHCKRHAAAKSFRLWAISRP